MARQARQQMSLWRPVALLVVVTSLLMLVFALMAVLVAIVGCVCMWRMVYLPKPKVTVLRSTGSRWTQMLAVLPYRVTRR